MMNQDTLVLKAQGKINLGLDITGKRPDGYHDLRMVMQTVQLCDEITLTRVPFSAVREGTPQIALTSSNAGLPTDERNIAWKAASQLLGEFNIRDGVRIHLRKRIPVAAGMAGGSTDAAAVLQGMNLLFDLRLGRKKLMDRGVRLGADVPFCIMRGTALSEGIGDILTELPGPPKYPLLLVVPPIQVATKDIYEAYDGIEVEKHPDIDALIDCLKAPTQSMEAIAAAFGNVLEEVTIPQHPVLTKIKADLTRSGACGTLMSGSGPSVFAVFPTPRKCRDAYFKMQAKYPDALVVETGFFNMAPGRFQRPVHSGN